MPKKADHSDDSQYEQEFETIWSKLYDPTDRDCPVRKAIEKIAWRKRPDHIDLKDFQRALLGRMYQKLRANFKNTRRKGLSAEEWRKTVGKLSQTAGAAAIEEVRSIIEGLRSTSAPKIYQLLDEDVAGTSMLGPDDGSAPLETSRDFDITGPRSPLLCTCLDPAELTLGFVQRTLPFHERASCLEHFRTCVQCFSLLQAITRRKKEGIDPAFVSLVHALEVKKDAIEINLLIIDSIEWDFSFFRMSQALFRRERWGPWRDLAKEDERIIQYLLKSRSIVIRNLKSLGYSVPVLESTFVSSNLFLNRNRKMELREPAFFVSDQLQQLARMRARRIAHYISLASQNKRASAALRLNHDLPQQL